MNIVGNDVSFVWQVVEEMMGKRVTVCFMRLL